MRSEDCDVAFYTEVIPNLMRWRYGEHFQRSRLDLLCSPCFIIELMPNIGLAAMSVLGLD